MNILRYIMRYIRTIPKLFRNIKIQARLIVLFLILSLIPLIITSFFSYKRSSNEVKAKISTYSVQVMDQISENINREIERLEYDSVEIAFSDVVQNTLLNYRNMSEWEREDAQNRMKDILVKKFSFLHDVSDVLIYTNDNDRINAYGDKGIKFNLKAEYLIKYLNMLREKKGTPVWAPVSVDMEEQMVKFATSPEQLNKSNGILVGRAIKSLEEGDIIGILFIRSNEKLFLNIYKDINIGQGADIFIIDSKGVVVSSRNPQFAVAKPYKGFSLIKRIIEDVEQRNRVFNFAIDGEQFLVAYNSIANTDWFVVSTIPFSYLNSESKKTMTSIIMLGLFCFALAIILSYLFSVSISSPLKKLTYIMEEVKMGNLSINIQDDSRDEIGVVSKNFNAMLNEINKLMEDVKSKEKQKRKAELKALQAQINPHFLSNTLNTVRWLAGIHKAENIENITTSLIQLLHVSIGKGGDFISIREEVEYIKNYINIQEYRYYNKFKVCFEIEEEILDFKILRFLVQPVVENSLIHGIEPMEGQGLIVIKGFKYDNSIKITVTDNGVGISEDKLENILDSDANPNKSRFSGIGINNVNERIRINFGEQYGLQIESVPNLYTTAEITHPIIF